MAVLSHAMLFIASLFATPMSIDHSAQAQLDTCQSIAIAAQQAIASSDSAWLPAATEVSVRAYGALRAREVSSVRVLGRCVVKNAPEDAQPVLYVPFGSQLDDSNDEDLASVRAETTVQFGHPAALGLGPADLHALRAPVTQLDRPPRV